MVPTLQDMDVCIVESFIAPERGQMFVIQEPDAAPLAIKRLIGIPGDTVELRDCHTYVNGVESDYGVVGTPENMTFVLGADEYLFLGITDQFPMTGEHGLAPLHETRFSTE